MVAATPALEAIVVATLGLEDTAGDNLVVGVETLALEATEVATLVLVPGATEAVTLEVTLGLEATGAEDLVVIPAREALEEAIPVLEA